MSPVARLQRQNQLRPVHMPSDWWDKRSQTQRAVGQTGRNQFTWQWWEGGRHFFLALWLSEEPPTVAVRGSAFCNSNQDTLYQLCPELSDSKFRCRGTHGQTWHYFSIRISCPIYLNHTILFGLYFSGTSLLLLSTVRQHFLVNNWAYFISSPVTHFISFVCLLFIFILFLLMEDFTVSAIRTCLWPTMLD